MRNGPTRSRWRRISRGTLIALVILTVLLVAARAALPYAGSFDDPDYSLMAIVVQAVRNAFVKALPKKLDRSIGLRQAKQAEAEERDDEAEQEGEPKEEANDEGPEEREEKHEPGVLGDTLP